MPVILHKKPNLRLPTPLTMSAEATTTTTTTSPAPKKVLMVLTSHGKIDGTDKATGWYLPEFVHPYNVFKKEGYEIHVCSIKGGDTTLSPSSLETDDQECKEFLASEEMMALTKGTKSIDDMSSDYDAVFFVGGFGVMFDFPFAPSADRIGREVYEKGGVVAAVCHGPIVLANIKLSSGELLVAGKTVAGFTNDEEAQAGFLEHLPMHEGKGRSCEDVLAACGGKYTKTSPWGCHVVTDSRVVTGQNPASAQKTGEAVVELLK